MAVVLSADAAAWRHHVEALVTRLGPSLVPVVKGNGYGFGRTWLAEYAMDLGVDELAVGTVHELLPTTGAPVRQHVLTPELEAFGDAVRPNVILTIGNAAQLAAAAERPGPIAVKLASSMRRYGATPAELPALLAALGLPHAFVLHLPLTGDDEARVAEIEAWLPHLPSNVPLSVSHLSPDTFEALTARHPRPWRLRLGTALWHGAARHHLRLTADVLDVRVVEAGTPAGYRGRSVPADGSIVLIGGGTAHGIHALDDGRSPFHFARTRLALLEPPHMHTSMAFVPAGEPCPASGELVDVQRPLTQTLVDRVVWIS